MFVILGNTRSLLFVLVGNQKVEDQERWRIKREEDWSKTASSEDENNPEDVSGTGDDQSRRRHRSAQGFLVEGEERHD